MGIGAQGSNDAPEQFKHRPSARLNYGAPSNGQMAVDDGPNRHAPDVDQN